jgi:hypothetical protein
MGKRSVILALYVIFQIGKKQKLLYVRRMGRINSGPRSNFLYIHIEKPEMI